MGSVFTGSIFFSSYEFAKRKFAVTSLYIDIVKDEKQQATVELLTLAPGVPIRLFRSIDNLIRASI
jgi:hypothetical protein